MELPKFLLLAVALLAGYCRAENKVVCYYDSRAHLREGQGKFQVSDIEQALQSCTHLVYGYAAINPDTYKLIPMNEQFDVIKDHYRKVTDLKKLYPRVKFLLSVGGNADVDGDGSEKNIKYRTLLESTTSRLAFVNSAYTLVKGFGFDGLDLAWEFPENKPKKIRGKLGGIWHSIKKTVTGDSVLDENANTHKEQFVSLTRELKNAFKAEGLLVSLSVLPNVNSSIFYDPRNLAPHLDYVTLMAFDFYTPERNPKEADLPAPLYELVDRRPDENVDAQVRFWLNNGFPASKLVLGIPTYGRAWKMDEDSDKNGVPPLRIDGAAEPGPYTKTQGLLSFPEVCTKLSGLRPQQQTVIKSGTPPSSPTTTTSGFKKITDSSKRKGTYMYQPLDENNNGGEWIAYEDPETAANKANYARAKGLGGIALIDLTLDDFHGSCSRDRYAILRAAKSAL